MTASVLGTPLEEARDDQREHTVLISDLHVPLDGGRVLEDLRTVVARVASDAHRTRLLILGDLFDFSVGPKQLAIGGHRDVVRCLRAASDAGLSITVLHGNRDFMLGPEFAEQTGARVVPGGLVFRLGSRKCLALHGDELCLRDVAYLRSKRWLRHPVTRWLLRRLPLAGALWLGQRAQTKSRASADEVGDPLRFEPIAEALHSAYDTGAECLVFGHIHRPARGEFASRGEYGILPAFDQHAVHLVAEAGEMSFRDRAGGRVADFAPRHFPSLVDRG